MSKNVLITIIVPIYNCKNYLSRCLDSICNQTYKNIDVLLIDDGSSDGSQLICDEYINKYSFVRTIHQDNKGVSIARNVGIENAKGEYIAFVDNDDYISKDFYEVLASKINETYSDFCCYNTYYNQDSRGRFNTIPYSTNRITGFYNNKDNIRNLVYGCYRTIWNGIYKLETIKKNNIKFPNDKRIIYEDVIFSIQFLKVCKSIDIINGASYFYYYNSKSVSHENSSDLVDRMNKSLSILKEQISHLSIRERNIFINSSFWSTLEKCMNTIIRDNSLTISKKFSRIKDLLSDNEVVLYLDSMKEYSNINGLHKLLYYLVVYRFYFVIVVFLYIYNLIYH